jgi:hypothetical protein
MHRDGVHDPGHRLGVRPDVRGGDVRIDPDDPFELRREPPCDRLELVLAQGARIDRHPSLRAPERDIHQRALPGHPHRQRADIIDVRRGVIAEAALGRPASDVVLDPIPGEHRDAAVIELDREVHRPFPLGHPKDRSQRRVELEVIRCLFELGQGGCEGACATHRGRRLGGLLHRSRSRW